MRADAAAAASIHPTHEGAGGPQAKLCTYVSTQVEWYIYMDHVLHAYSLLTPCLPLAYYLPALPTRWLILSLYLRRLRSHVQIRSVLRDSVDPYALENVDF